MQPGVNADIYIHTVLVGDLEMFWQIYLGFISTSSDCANILNQSCIEGSYMNRPLDFILSEYFQASDSVASMGASSGALVLSGAGSSTSTR